MREPDPEGAAYAAAQFTKRAAATRIFRINLHKFFPPDDEIATCMARLCILREDLAIEVNGIVAGPYEWLDGNGREWRRNYFFRNAVRTLREITSAIHKLNCNPAFQRSMENVWSPEDRKRFQDFSSELQAAHKLVKDVRNIIGGHVNHTAVERALKLLGNDAIGTWEVPHDRYDKPAHTHYPFLNILLLAMLQAGDKESKDIDEVMKIPEVTASLSQAIAHIDNIFELYLIERELLP